MVVSFSGRKLSGKCICVCVSVYMCMYMFMLHIQAAKNGQGYCAENEIIRS